MMLPMTICIHLLVIDPQVDFCDPSGSLFVPGAYADMVRLASMVDRLGPRLDDIHVTTDQHHVFDIAHPMWWKDSAGRPPAPFTVITVSDLSSGKWTTKNPSLFRRSLDYLKQLEASGRYPHVIWPEHCLIGDAGSNVVPVLSEALHRWERQNDGVLDIVSKGSNVFTEHFSAIRAEVPDPSDPSTQTNVRLIQTIEQADVILIAGEALSHCVANTVRDMVAGFSDPKITEKCHILTDASSSVPGFESYGTAFLDEMRALGMKFTTTDTFLA